MSNGRWRIEFVEVKENLPVLWQRSKALAELGPPPGELSVSALMSSFDLLARRGSGGSPWRAFYRYDPIAFLLDVMNDAVSLWNQNGELVYRNRAAERLGLGRSDEVTDESFTSADRPFERRCLRFRHGSTDYVLEIIREERTETKLPKPRASSGRSRRRGSRKPA